MQHNQGAQVYQYYTLYELPVSSINVEIEKYQRRAQWFLSCSRVLLLLAFISISIAGFAPLWTVASLRGSGQIFMVDYSVDFNIGSGIWVKNVCFGGSVPSSTEVLAKFGISCEGTSALDGCEFDENGRDINGNEECTKLRTAEALSAMAVFCVLSALFISCCSSPDSKMRLGFADLFALLALVESATVSEIMKKTQMMDKEFGCVDILGAELCYDRGPSLILQNIGTADVCLALLFTLLCQFSAFRARRLEAEARSIPAATGIRYAVPAGVVVV